MVFFQAIVENGDYYSTSGYPLGPSAQHVHVQTLAAILRYVCHV